MKPVLMALTVASIAGGPGAGTGIAAPAPASPLSRYADRARLLVISAPTADDPELRRQDAALDGQAAGLKARDVVVVRSVGQAAAHGPQAGAEDVRRAAGLPAGRFGVALVGKDGGVKLKRRAPIPVDELFRAIDAMPMRRDEMRRASPG